MRVGQLSLVHRDLHTFDSLKFSVFLMVGLSFVLLSSSVVAWESFGAWLNPAMWPLLSLCVVAYIVNVVILRQFQRLPKAKIIAFIILSVSLAFVAVVVVLALGRFYYSRSFLVTAYGMSIVSFIMLFEFNVQSRPLRLAVVPGGMASELLQLGGVGWVLLREPELPPRVDGLVVDWHERLSGDWIRLLSNCSLRRLPVYHAAVVYEAATGRVSLSHLSDGMIDDFCMSPFYVAFKRLVDLLMIISLAPFVLPICVLLALAIRLDSSGPILYWQERVGQGGRFFRMCKFRSMRINTSEVAASFAEHDDGRITRVGRFIRNTRLDELPQFWNVLRGEMSMIGPRPEQVPFAKIFGDEIAFYGYRHLVRPGITGWAQVNRGYTAGSVETRDKLELDLYYIKYFSLWLDALIFFKTIRTILTGDGAR